MVQNSKFSRPTKVRRESVYDEDFSKTQINKENLPPPGEYTVKALEQLANGHFVWMIQSGPHKGKTFTGPMVGVPNERSTIN